MDVATPPTVVMFSTADWNAPYWTNKQHIASRLAKRGTRLLYIESLGIRRPGANSRDLARMARRIGRVLEGPRQVDENLWVYSPLTIPFGHRHSVVRSLNARLLSRTIERWLGANASDAPVVWTYHPYVLDTLARIRAEKLVYHCVDDVAAVPGVDATAYAAAELALLRKADVVFTTSLPLQRHCSEIAGDRSVYERNVADIEHFASARRAGSVPVDISRVPHPRIVYTGVLSDFKLDLSLIEETATTRSDWHWVLIGNEPEGHSNPIIAKLRRLGNVHLLGYRPYATLPNYLAAADIAVLPNLVDGHAASVFPMKLYEYLAAGRPVLATPMPSLEGMREVIAIADRHDWVEAVGRILADPPGSLALDDPRLRDFSWEARMDRMLKRLAVARAVEVT